MQRVRSLILLLAASSALALRGEEASEHVMTMVSGTQITGYVSTSAIWRSGSSATAQPVQVLANELARVSQSELPALRPLSRTPTMTPKLSVDQLVAHKVTLMKLNTIDAIGGTILVSVQSGAGATTSNSLLLEQRGPQGISVNAGKSETLADDVKASGGNIYAIGINNGGVPRTSPMLTKVDGKVVLK